MKEKKYITIGTPIITKEIFRNVLRPLNNYNFQITGGFWSSEYLNDAYNISDWFSYLQQIKEIALEKNLNQSTIFTLKENAKILTIDNPNIVYELARKYPSYHYILNYYEDATNKNIIFDFEKLSQNYDGIFVNKKNLTPEINYTIFKDWVNSLLLFNLDCIKEYQTAPIIYDIEDPYSIPYIDKYKISDYKKIEEESYEHQILFKIVNQIFMDLMSQYNNYSFEDYDEYFSIVIQNIQKTIFIIKEEQDLLITKIKENLQEKNISTSKNIIYTNVTLNFLTKYLIQENEKIKTLPETKTKKLKWYPIY